ncbi:MAG: hypothetical protein JJU36_14330 [Phycisphaeraceae bacterium]|nr:hypothetical protein [Phycisphaeraceae bacterium]
MASPLRVKLRRAEPGAFFVHPIVPGRVRGYAASMRCLHRRHRLWFFLLLPMLLAGCRTHIAPPDWGFDPEQVESPDGRIVASKDIYQLGDRRLIFIDPAADPPAELVISMTADSEPGTYRARVGDRYESVLRVDDSGDLVAVVEIDRQENARVAYEPAIPVLLARMKVGEVVEGEVRMTIRDLRRGTVRQRGTCRWELELLGETVVATPAGVMEAWIVRTRRTADFGAAGFELVQHEAYVPGLGRVASHSVRRIRVLATWLGPRTEELLFKEVPDPE